MATLKEHQNAMIDLLANGSAIPASAARLAHALHDVLALMVEHDSGPRGSRVSEHMGTFIQDVRLAADLEAHTQCGDSAPPRPFVGVTLPNGLRYGDNVLWFLNELAAFDASSIDSDDFDVYGEDQSGAEGCATISITELAADAAKLLSSREFINDTRLAADLDSAVSPRGSTLIDHLRAELATVTSQRDTYKAQYESYFKSCVSALSDLEDAREEIEELKARIVDMKSAV